MSKIDEKTTLLDDIDAIETINDDNDTHSNVYADDTGNDDTAYYESTCERCRFILNSKYYLE